MFYLLCCLWVLAYFLDLCPTSSTRTWQLSNPIETSGTSNLVSTFAGLPEIACVPTSCKLHLQGFGSLSKCQCCSRICILEWVFFLRHVCTQNLALCYYPKFLDEQNREIPQFPPFFESMCIHFVCIIWNTPYPCRKPDLLQYAFTYCVRLCVFGSEGMLGSNFSCTWTAVFVERWKILCIWERARSAHPPKCLLMWMPSLRPISWTTKCRFLLGHRLEGDLCVVGVDPPQDVRRRSRRSYVLHLRTR